MSSPTQENLIYLVSTNNDTSTVVQQAGYQVRIFKTLAEMISTTTTNAPSGVFFNLDSSSSEANVNIPDLVAYVRENWPETPILATVTGNDDVIVKRALKLGVSDFLIHSFSVKELTTRLTIQQEYAKARNAAEVINFGDIEVNSRQRTVKGPVTTKTASPIEINLLMSLARANGDIVDKDTIKTECWGEMKVTDNALHRKLHALRQLLRSVSNNVTVETKYGAGIFLGYKEKTESTRTTQTFDQAS